MRKYLKKALNNPFFLGSAVMIIGSNATNFINYVYHLIVGRLLGPANYGELASLISLIGLLGIIPASVSLVIIKYVSAAKSNDEISRLINWLKAKIFQYSFIFCLLVIVISPAISSFLKINEVSYIILIAISFLFSLQSILNRAILQGLLKFNEMIISILMENSTKLIATVLLISLGFQVGGAMWAFVLSSLLGWYITNLYLKIKTNSDQDISKDIRSMALFTIPVLIQSISLTSLYSSDVVLVKHFFSSHDAGIYASLSTLGKIIFFGAGPISAVMFPLVSQRQSRGIGYRKIFIYSFLATALLCITISLIYWLVPSFAIRFLYGSAYLEAAPLLILFAIFMSFFTLASLMISFSLSLGRIRVVFFPLIAAISQILGIWIYHNNLTAVITVSIIISALLLATLFIYSRDEKRILDGDKTDLGYSSGI